jgi:demethylmenaquinone methyltransferase/2-methoxy-6-polyprenyl-1,4-benzoquinol methylase
MNSNENIENKDKNPPREDVHKMFDRISGRYDLLNRLLSFRRDVIWRKNLAELLPQREGLKILDLATGTGDVLFSLVENNNHIRTGIGIDMASEMLKLAQIKINKNKLQDKLSLIRGDATQIPFAENSFDAVTIAFGIRNVVDVSQSLSEMYRILSLESKAMILEFSLPKNRFIKSLYLFYFRKILPFVGGVISGDSYAYRYLNQTVETFPYGDDFCELMRKAGFESVRQHPMTSGIATIYEGIKR